MDLTLQNQQCRKCKVRGVFWRFLFLSLLLGVVLYPATSLASPEVATFKSAVVWRGDDKGDYKFDKEIFSLPGTYEIDTAHTTDGNIETITATWKFTGKVTLEVSADNGLNYTTVVNGVPLKARDTGVQGFVRGDRIRWKVTIGPDSELAEVRIVYTDTSGVGGGFGEPQLSGFKFRKAIYINGSSSEELFNYQMKIKVGESEGASSYDVHCGANIELDFKDMRFTAADGEILLPYYLENVAGTYPNRIATFWVKIPQIPSEGLTIYLYYGNYIAESLSNPDAVFDFYDNFDKEELNTEKWEVNTELEGNYSITNSELKLSGAKIISKDYQFKDGILEWKARPQNEIRGIIREDKENPDLTQVGYSSNYEGAEHCIAVGNIVKANDAQPILAGSKYNYRVIARGTDLTFERYDDEFIEKQASVSFEDIGGLTIGYIGLESGTGSVSYYDWLRVRKLAQAQPIVTSSGEEESTNLPTFIGTTLSENGNLILAEENTNGNYISKVISTPFQTRIMIPTWSVVNYGLSSMDYGLSIDISADSGVTYKTNCENGAYYYASRGDFTAGSNLRCRVAIAKSDSEEVISPQVEELSMDYRPGKILLITPNGGEVWSIGTQKEIVWTAMEYESTYPMKLEYATDGGKTYKTIIEQIENTGVYLWQVPDKESDEVVVKISDAYQPEVFDTSDGLFKFERVEEISDYLGKGEGSWNNPGDWVGGKVPDVYTEVTIDTDATVYTDKEISFKSLTIGDGEGKHTTTLLLRHRISPKSGQIIVRKGGRLIQESNEPLSIIGNLTIKSGGVLTHSLGFQLNITAQNIIIEPKARVDVDEKNYPDGGVIRLSAKDKFSIFGTITADGLDNAGGKGGSIHLIAYIFGGEGAVIHAQGGSGPTEGGRGGEIYVKGEGGAITGTMNVNGGKGEIKGKAGSIVFE